MWAKPDSLQHEEEEVTSQEKIRRLDEERQKAYDLFENLAKQEMIPGIPKFPGIPNQIDAYALMVEAWGEARLLRSKPEGRSDLPHQIILFDTIQNAFLVSGRQKDHMPGVSATRVTALYWGDLGLYAVVPKVGLEAFRAQSPANPQELANAPIGFSCRIEVAQMVKSLTGLQFPLVP